MLYNKEQLKEIIPYDDPFMWVEEIETMDSSSIVGYYHAQETEEYFKGHFVDFPIMPGVLIVEGIAQTATVLLRQQIKDNANKHLLAYQVRNAAFFSPVLPGDKVKYKVKLLGFYEEKIANFYGEAFVNDEKKTEVRFSVAVMDKKEMANKFKKS